MKFKKETLRIGTALAIFAFGFLFKGYEAISVVLFVLAYALAGFDVLYRAVRNILRGQIFDENFLMAIATVGAFIIGDFAEGAAVMLFYQVGELFQSYAVNQSRKSITELMNIRPDFATVLREGEYVTVDPEEVKVDETILVKPGEKVPSDGVVIEGSTTLDTAALTGEALPREIKTGEEVISGCININGTILVRVSKEFEESTVAKILDLVENASSKKQKPRILLQSLQSTIHQL